MRRTHTCEHYYDQRLCAHEVACSEAEMCVLRIQQEEERYHEEEVRHHNEELRREIEAEAAEYCHKVGF